MKLSFRFVVFAACLGFSIHASAVTATWAGNTGTTGQWLTDANWSTAAVPGGVDIANFTGANTGTIYGIDFAGSTNNGAGNQTVGQVMVSGTAARTIGAATATNGVLNLQGVDGTLISNVSGFPLTLQPSVNSATGVMSVKLATAGNINVTNNGAVTISSIVTGDNGFTKIGAGTGALVLSGANTYNGVSKVSAGTLRLGNASALGGTGAGNETIVEAGGTLDVGGTAVNPLEIIRVVGTGVGGNGAVVNTGAGQTNAFNNLALTGDASFGGAVRFDIRTGTAPTLDLGGFKLTKIGTSQFTVVGGIVTPGDIDINAGTFSVETTTTMGSPGTITVGSAGTFSIYGTTSAGITRPIISNAGSITNLGSDGALGSNITLAAGDTKFIGTNVSTFTGAISGPGALVVNGTGTYILSGANSYEGGTIINSGSLQFNQASAIPALGLITVNAGGTLGLPPKTDFAAFFGSGKLAASSTGGIGLSGEYTQDILFSTYHVTPSAIGYAKYSGALSPDAGAYTFSGAAGSVFDVTSSLTGAATLTKLGLGTLVLSGANSYTGVTSVAAGGTLSVTTLGNTGSTTSNVGTNGTISLGTANNGQSTLLYTGLGETTDRVINFASAAGGILTQNGSGLLKFTAPATGSTTVDYGIVLNGSGVGEFAGITTGPTNLVNFTKEGIGSWTLTGALQLASSATKIGALRSNGGILAFAPTATTASGANAMSLSRLATGGGVLEIANGAQVFTTTANSAAGILGGWATIGDSTWAVTNGSSTAINGLPDASYTANTWTSATTNVDVTSSNTASGPLANSLRFNTPAAITQTLAPGVANILTSGGILVTPAVGANTVIIPNTASTTLTGSVNGDLIIHQHNTAGELTINAVITENTGATRLTKSGPGTLNLGGVNLYTGGTFINEGVLNVSAGGAVAPIRRNVSVGTLGTLRVSAANGFGTTQFQRVEILSILGGKVDLNIAGTQMITSGAVVMTGGTFSGIAGSRFDIRNAGAGNTNVTVNASDKPSVFSVPTLGLAETDATFTVAKGHPASGIDLLVSSVITGGATNNLIKNGPGVMALTATNTYPASTTISAGTLQVGDGGATGALGAGALVNNGSLVFKRDATADLTVANAISGTGSVTQAGTGKTILTGTLGYTGDTTVTAGILSLGASTLADSSAVRIAAGGTLDLTFTGTDLVGAFYVAGERMLPGIWGAVGSGAQFTTPRITGSGTLTVPAVAGDPAIIYADWVNGFNLDAGTTGRGFDADNDGMNNFGEFALDGNPKSPNRSGKVVTKTVAGVATITLPVRKDLRPFLSDANGLYSPPIDGVVYRIQASTDLVNWTLGVTEVTGVDTSALPALSGSPAQWQYRTFQVPAGNAKVFLRAKVSEAP